MVCSILLSLLIIHLSSLSTALLRLNITSVDRTKGGDIVSYAESCQTNQTVCQSSGAKCRQIDGRCACPENSTFYNFQCLKKISLGCQYSMGYGQKSNEIFVPTMKLQGVIASKQIGGILQYISQENKKISAFKSCQIDESQSKYMNGGAWVPLFGGKRNTKDFMVESVGDSNYKVLRWNGAAHVAEYQGFLVQLKLNCKALEGQTPKGCLLFKVSGYAFYLNTGHVSNRTTRTDTIETTPTLKSPLASATATKPETGKTQIKMFQISMNDLIIIASSAGGVLVFALIISIICCCRCSKRRGRKSKEKKSNNSTTKTGEDIVLNVMQPNCSTQLNGLQDTNAAVIATANDIEGIQSGSQNKKRKQRPSRHIYSSIRSKLEYVVRGRTGASSSKDPNDIYDYACCDRPTTTASSNDDIANHKLETRPFINDSEEYIDMNKPGVKVPPQLQIIAEVENTGNSDYELPVVGEDELYSYLQLEEEEHQSSNELNDKNVANLVSKFSKSMEVVHFPDIARKSPNLQAKSQNCVHN